VRDKQKITPPSTLFRAGVKPRQSGTGRGLNIYTGDNTIYLDFHIRVHVPALIEKPAVAITLLCRQARYGFTFRRIKLTQGKPVGERIAAAQYAIVDPEDYVELNRHKWFAKNDKNTYYAARIENGKKIYMHRQIKPPPPFDPAQGRGRLVVDHINHKGFDNRKINLQIVTVQENNWNSGKTIKEASSKYKGVSRSKRTNKWRAVICVNGQDMHLGYFDDESEAAKAYDAAAKEYRGGFAVLNFTTEDTRRRKGYGETGREHRGTKEILNPNI
jgi:hypothetical protein